MLFNKTSILKTCLSWTFSWIIHRQTTPGLVCNSDEHVPHFCFRRYWVHCKFKPYDVHNDIYTVKGSDNFKTKLTCIIALCFTTHTILELEVEKIWISLAINDFCHRWFIPKSCSFYVQTWEICLKKSLNQRW